MNLAEQAARRVALARAIGADPQRWVATPDAEAAMIADGAADAWSGDWERLHRIPFDRGPARTASGLDPIVTGKAA